MGASGPEHPQRRPNTQVCHHKKESPDKLTSPPHPPPPAYLCAVFVVRHQAVCWILQTATTRADVLFQLSNDALMRFSLTIQKCRGRCYDSASNVSGIRTGLRASVLGQEPCAPRAYIHYIAHLESVAVRDVAQNIVAFHSFIAVIYDLITLIRNSPKCH